MEVHSGIRKISTATPAANGINVWVQREKRACLGEALSEDIAVKIVGRELTSKRSSEIHLYLPEAEE